MHVLLAQFFIGAVLVLAAARIFLLVVQQLSVRFRISPLIVGTLLMSFGATLPELSLTLTSLSNNDPGLAMGTVVGSVIVNLGLLFGLAVMIGRVRIGTHKTQAEGGLILLATGTLLYVLLAIPDQLVQAKVMGITWVLIFGTLLFLSWYGRKHEDVAVVRVLSHKIRAAVTWKSPKMIALLLLSIVGLGGGSMLIVQSVEGLSVLFGISTTILGFTLTAFTTSLPELAVTVVSNRAKEEKALVGALVGSSVINLTLFPSIIAWKGGYLQLPLLQVCWLLAVVGMFAFTIFYHRGRIVQRAFGVALIMAWLGFVYVLSIR